MPRPTFCTTCNQDYADPIAWESVGADLPPDGVRCGVCAKQCQTDTRAKTRLTRPRHWFRGALGETPVWACSKMCRSRQESANWQDADGAWYCTSTCRARGQAIDALVQKAHRDAAADGSIACVGKCSHCAVDCYAGLAQESGSFLFCRPHCVAAFENAHPGTVRDDFVARAKKAEDDGVFERIASLEPERVAAIESRLRESEPPAAPATSTQASSENRARESNR